MHVKKSIATIECKGGLLKELQVAAFCGEEYMPENADVSIEMLMPIRLEVDAIDLDGSVSRIMDLTTEIVYVKAAGNKLDACFFLDGIGATWSEIGDRAFFRLHYSLGNMLGMTLHSENISYNEEIILNPAFDLEALINGMLLAVSNFGERIDYLAFFDATSLGKTHRLWKKALKALPIVRVHEIKNPDAVVEIPGIYMAMALNTVYGEQYLIEAQAMSKFEKNVGFPPEPYKMSHKSITVEEPDEFWENISRIAVIGLEA